MALLGGAAALLAGCDSFDNLFGERRQPLPGERRPVLRTDPPLVADEGLDPRAVTLPPATEIADWPMAGGRPNHAPGHASLSPEPRVAWRASAGSGSEYRARITSGPVIAGGLVFAVDAWGHVSAHALDSGDPAQLATRLAPLTAEGNPWRASAREAQALLALRRGATEEARRILEALVADAAAPAGLRERAQRVAAGLRS